MRRVQLLGWQLVLLPCVLVGALAQTQAEGSTAQLPDGEGKALLLDACTQCHSLESTLAQRKDRVGWGKTVNDMILRGAFLTPAEAETIVTYLSRTRGFQPVDVNRATLEELLRATPLQPAEAEAILDYRACHGPFRSFEDLKKVAAVKPERFEQIKEYLLVSPAPPHSASEPKPN